jgi:hypothetical protein
VLLLSGLPLAADVGLGLSPMRVELALAPGASYSGTLRLVNERDPVRVRASVLDFYLDSEQTPQFEADLPEEAPYSCRSWLVVNPMEGELNLKGELPVRFTIRVPANAQPRSYYCAAGFTSLPPASEIKGFGLQSAIRIVAAFYVVIGNPPVEGALDGIALERSPGGKELRAVVVMANSGKMYYRPAGTLVVLDPAGDVIEEHDIKSFPVLPERKQRFLVPLEHVSDGQEVTLRVRLDLGDGEVQEGIAKVQAAAAAQ